MSNNLGAEPLSTCLRCSRQNKKYVVIPQPDIIQKCNASMAEVDRLDQNINHFVDPDHQQKVVLLHCDMATGHCSSGMPGIWKSGGIPSALNFRRELCVLFSGFPQRLVRGSPLEVR
jgi:hypothetical protein